VCFGNTHHIKQAQNMSREGELAQATSSENEDNLTPSQNKKRSLETQKSTEYFYSLLRVAETKEKILEAFQHFYSENSHQCNLMINKAKKYFKLNTRTSRSRRKNLADPEIAELFFLCEYEILKTVTCLHFSQSWRAMDKETKRRD
jgi:hypothetical protein